MLRKGLRNALTAAEKERKKAMDLIDGMRGMTLVETQQKIKEVIRENKRVPLVLDCYKALLKKFS